MDAFTCAEAEPLLPLVADGAVDPDSDPQLFTHLAACPACQRTVAQHDLVTLALGCGARRNQAPRARILTFPRLAAAAAMIAALGTLAWIQLRDPPRTPSIAQAPPVRAAPAAPPTVAASVPVAAALDVVRIPRADGGPLYLVRRGSDWIALDPAQIDGPEQATAPNADNHQVRY